VPSLAQCRQTCLNANDCGGATICTNIAAGVSACIAPGDQSKIPQKSDDQSLGTDCTNNPGLCGANAPICSAPLLGESFAAADATETDTCTIACTTGFDPECQNNVPDNCTGDCALTYANSCCVPNEDPNAPVPPGTITNNGQLVPTFCRTRFFCFDYAVRCTPGQACPGGVRTGTCQASGDGGACSAGTRGYFECCSRDGQCGSGAPFCEPALDGLGGYCTRSCTGTVDANGHDDCYDPSTPFAQAQCWLTTYIDAGADASGDEQCNVVQNPNPTCRTSPFPCFQVDAQGNCALSQSSTDTVACNLSFERPRDDLSDNRYCEALDTCYNPSDSSGVQCPQ
jgi:hypothetical protein